MKKAAWKIYAFWIILTEAVGALAALLTRNGTEFYKTAVEKPPLSPPAIVFPIVWAILYLLMGVGAARVALSPESTCRSKALKIFLAQLAVNFFWTIIFFNLRAYAFAFVWIILLGALVYATITAFRKCDQLAGNLQIPYFVWILFAAYLNAGVLLLNR